MAAILNFFIISSLKPYVGLSCNFVEDIGTIWILRFARIMHSLFFQSRLIMISLIKVSDSGPLRSLVGFKGVARLEASGSDKQPLPNHAILSKSSQDQV